MEKTYITRSGYEKLVADLEHLQTVKRREIAEQLAQARAHGDLKENAEYDAAKHSQAMNETRIRELQEKIASAEIVNTDNVATDKVIFGTKVTLWDFKYEEEIVYEITGSEEADPIAGKISVNSPVATALLGHIVGDQVDVKTPGGMVKYEIRNIAR
ncbi:MAG: transcription elongation factor GreA [Chitinispirillia bacterium]|nr:transcription elongation factor GreA [Chitinispirillia bacterium]MCL2268194.1 transcription elongation factor GreA [Chitinispirillia bacterium]